MNDMSRVVLVTGGTGALGRVVCQAFLDSGATVHTSYIVERELETLPAAMRDSDRLKMRRVDLGSEDEVRAWFADLPRLDVLVNVAGGFSMSAIADTSLAAWDLQFNMNLKTTFLCCREALGHMNRQGEGRIVNVGAFAATRRTPGMGPYTASKAAVLHITEVLAEETLAQKITVNAVLPTVMDTPGNRAANPDADFGAWVPLENVAQTIMFLAAPESWHITGALIPLRGHI